MKRFLRTLLILLLILGVIEPVKAVFEESNLSHTLRVLKAELRHAYKKTSRAQIAIKASRENQQREMVELMEDCNELSIILYSQKQNFTFDLTYALEEVSKRYRDFSRNRRPFVEIIDQMDVEIERYQKLIRTLRCLPPVKMDVDSLSSDSTFILASRLQEEARSLHMHNTGKDTVLQNHPSPRGSLIKTIATTLITGSSDNVTGDLDDGAETSETRFLDTSSVDTLVESGPIVSIEDTTSASGKIYAFILSGASLDNRDSCLFYAENLLSIYEETKDAIIIDSVNYDATWSQLQEAYDYAQERFKKVQEKIFIEGQTNYFSVLRRFNSNWRRLKSEVSDKWGASVHRGVKSQWRLQNLVGMVLFVLFYLLVAAALSNLIVRPLRRRIKLFKVERFKNHGLCMILFVTVVIFAIAITIAMMFSDQHFMKMGARHLVEFAWLLAAIFLSFAIRLDKDQVKSGLLSYLPIMALCLIIIFIRISFSPNSLINVFLPPILLIFTLWQSRLCRKLKNKIPFSDRVYNLITLLVLITTTALSWSGYVLMSILVIIWWIFQLSVIQSITAVSDLLKIYYDRQIVKRKMAYRRTHSYLINPKIKGSHIEVTWAYDLLKNAIIPAVAIWSIPLCVYLAAKVFDLSSVSLNYISKDFLNYNVIHLSVSKILTAVSLAFAFNYIRYASKAFYRVYKIRSTLARTGQKELPENMINFTLANSIITIVTWGAYIITSFILLHIPSTAIQIVGAGLATGVGFALKDVINNFFYGVSLMSGRLRVGDYVECDGVRGVVDSINYQSTMIETEHGSVMAFPNSNLYNKNFKNLTRNKAYELLILPVGIKYGSDVDQVRTLLKKALIKLNVKDRYGRMILEPKYGIVVRLAEFGDSSILLKVYQQVLVTERYKYAAAANEIIYNTLNANGIQIPFPQRDIYIKHINTNSPKAESEEVISKP